MLLAARIRRLERAATAAGIEFKLNPDEIRLDYDAFRLAFRDVARNTDERTVIAAVLPPKRFCPHTVSLEEVFTDEIRKGRYRSTQSLGNPDRLFLCALFNSFCFDYILRKSVTAHVSFFLLYNAPAPRPTSESAEFRRVVRRAARLSCRTHQYDALAKDIGIGSNEPREIDSEARARLRAEVDGLVAHLYGLTEEEFTHILSTFPLVPESVRTAAREAYHSVAEGLIQ